MKRKIAKRRILCASLFIFAAALILPSGSRDKESAEELQSAEPESIESESTEPESTEQEQTTESESTETAEVQSGEDLQSSDSTTPPEAAFVNSDGKLRRYAYDDETTAMLSSGGPLHLISGSTGTFVQTRYNARGQLLSRSVWKTGGDENSETTRDSFTEFTYSAASERPEKRLVTSAEMQEETVYLPNGKESRVNMYKIDGDKKELLSRTDFRYDANGKPTGTTKTTPNKTTGSTAAAGGAASGTDEEIRYQYTGKSKNADTERIKDGKTIMKTEYESDTRYTETRYFDLGFSVETTYENDVLVLERFMQGDKEIRKNSF